jgi:cell division protein FtsN
MSRDTNKNARTNGTRKKSAGGMLIGLFAGLVIGVLIAAGVVWYIYRMPSPFTSKMPPPSQPQQPARDSQTPLALPGKPGDPVNDKPRFDFYKMLPGNGESSGETSGAATPATPATPMIQTPPDPKPAETGKEPSGKDTLLKEPVFLQTGSFLNAGDADNQKARLAMMGVEAGVQQVMLQDKVWYRVRLGPFRRLEEVNALRAELARQGVDANVVRKD